MSEIQSLHPGNAVWLEPGSFQDYGGWVLDTQFIESMGAAFLLAHGLGKPVGPAATKVSFPKPGPYRIWVYTRDWVAPWKQDCAPGLFRLSVGGKLCSTVFGISGAEWHWQDGGIMEISGQSEQVALQDSTGYEGRCGGVLFCRDLSFVPSSDRNAILAMRAALCGTAETPALRFDLIVAGGGIAGMVCALKAARHGLKTALVQDRPVFGGNNSSEVRVWLSGKTQIPPFTGLGQIVNEMDQKVRDIFGSGNRAENYEDGRKQNLLAAEPNLSLYLGCSTIDAKTAESRITSITLYDTKTGQTRNLEAELYADCTGDAVLGAACGARYEMTTAGHMEMSNFWSIADTGMPQAFPPCPWALDIGDAYVPGRLRAGGYNPEGEKQSVRMLGCWYWGSGFEHNPIDRAEYARDTNFRAMYGVWDALKNRDHDFATYKLGFSAYIGGKRESRRLLGDILLTKDDFLRKTPYDDGIVGIDWHLDKHTPNRKYYPAFKEGDAFLASDCHEVFQPPYLLPYRCLYSNNIGNLFMAGRCISVTHDALGPVRVMHTCGMMGEVVGEAAYLCRSHQVLPREIYRQHLKELKAAFI
jgi:hypothetical protein